MFSRKCALDVTPLDEKPFLYEEELILGISMEKAGWKTVYDPKSVVHHLHGNSTEKVKTFAYTCNICSEIYFCREYLKMKKCKGQILRSTPNTAPLICGAYNTQPEGLLTMA